MGKKKYGIRTESGRDLGTFNTREERDAWIANNTKDGLAAAINPNLRGGYADAAIELPEVEITAKGTPKSNPKYNVVTGERYFNPIDRLAGSAYNKSYINALDRTRDLSSFVDMYNENHAREITKNPEFAHIWDTGANVLEGLNLVSAGAINRLSPAQNIRTLIDTYDLLKGDMSFKDYTNNFILGNRGIVTEKFNKEHPYWSMLANGVVDGIGLGLRNSIRTNGIRGTATNIANTSRNTLSKINDLNKVIKNKIINRKINTNQTSDANYNTNIISDPITNNATNTDLLNDIARNLYIDPTFNVDAELLNRIFTSYDYDEILNNFNNYKLQNDFIKNIGVEQTFKKIIRDNVRKGIIKIPEDHYLSIFGNVVPNYTKLYNRGNIPFTADNIPGKNRTKLYEDFDKTAMYHINISPDEYKITMKNEYDNIPHGASVGFDHDMALSTSSAPMFIHQLLNGLKNGKLYKVFSPQNNNNNMMALNNLGRKYMRVGKTGVKAIPEKIDINTIDKNKILTNEEFVDWYSSKLQLLRDASGVNFPDARVEGKVIYVPTMAGIKYKFGGKHKTLIPNVINGGQAIPIGNNMYYMKGNSHELGGIDIGKDLEVEDGELVKVTPKSLKVFSDQPIFNGISPAKAVLGGANPNKVFNGQEEFKDRMGLNDDGTKKKKARLGTEDNPTELPEVVFTPKTNTKHIHTKDGKKVNTKDKNSIYYVKYRNRDAGIFDRLFNGGSELYYPNKDGQPAVYKKTNPGTFGGGSTSGGGNTISFDRPINTKKPKVVERNTIVVPIIEKETFNDAFKNARTRGDKEFEFNGKKYNTELGDDPRNYEAGQKRVRYNVKGVIPIVDEEDNKKKKRVGGTYTVNGKVRMIPFTGERKQARLGINMVDDNRIKDDIRFNLPNIDFTKPIFDNRSTDIILPNRTYNTKYATYANTNRNSIVNPLTVKIDTQPTIKTNFNNLNSSSDEVILNKTKTRNNNFKNFIKSNLDDAIGTGANLAGSIVNYFTNRNAINRMSPPSTPVTLQAGKLKTKMNINPQLDKLRESLAGYERNTNANTQSSAVAQNRINAARLANVATTNELYGNKENAETRLINQDVLNQQQVRDKNITNYNKYLEDLVAYNNNITNLKSENLTNLISGINTSIQNTLANREKRRQARNTLIASALTAPNSVELFREGLSGKNARFANLFKSLFNSNSF